MTNAINFNNDKFSEFNLSSGTLIRINEALRGVDYYFALRDYAGVFHYLKIVFNNVSPFTRELVKGIPKKLDLFNYAMTLETECENFIEACKKTQTDGTKIFMPSMQCINKIREYDFYLRDILLMKKIYMAMTNSMIPAART